MHVIDMHQMYNFGANLKPVIKQNIVKLKKNLQKISLLHSAMFDSASPDLQFSDWQEIIQRSAPSVDI